MRSSRRRHSIRLGSAHVQDCASSTASGPLPVIVGDWVTSHNARSTAAWLRRGIIGIGARVLNNCRIGTGSIIASGGCPGGHVVHAPLWAGVPAKMRRDLSDKTPDDLEYAKNYWTTWILQERPADRAKEALGTVDCQPKPDQRAKGSGASSE